MKRRITFFDKYGKFEIFETDMELHNFFRRKAIVQSITAPNITRIEILDLENIERNESASELFRNWG